MSEAGGMDPSQPAQAPSRRATVVAVIPARAGSQRLPGKNILPIAGKPLIAYSIQAALAARRISRVIVTTDDDAIARVALDCGAEVVKRPAEIAQADSPIDDAYRHVLDQLRQQGHEPEIVVGIQANVPIRHPGEIDEVVGRLEGTPRATAVATAKRVTERPEWMKRIDPATGRVKPWMPNDAGYRTQDLPELYYLDGATIAMRAAVLRGTTGDRRVHAYLGDHVLIHVHDAKFAVEVDEQEDVPLADLYLRSAGTGA